MDLRFTGSCYNLLVPGFSGCLSELDCDLTLEFAGLAQFWSNLKLSTGTIQAFLPKETLAKLGVFVS